MSSLKARPPIIRIVNGSFYRHHPNAHTAHPNPPLFRDLSFELPSASSKPHNWCIVGPSLSGKTSLLNVLRGRLLSDPATARTFPFLSSDTVSMRLKSPQKAMQYVGFETQSVPGGAPTTAAYLSARYESRREILDFSLRDFLLGNTELNPLEKDPQDDGAIPSELFARVVRDLRLEHLLDLPMTFLSNGQGRRARIGRALLLRPEVLLLDEPFMGLDPPTVRGLSPILGSLAQSASPRLVLSARPQDPLPEWITHLIYLRTDCQIGSMGPKEEVLRGLEKYAHGVTMGTLAEDAKMPISSLEELGREIPSSSAVEAESEAVGRQPTTQMSQSTAEPLVEMEGCRIRYGTKIALGNWSQEVDGVLRDGLHWTVRKGERWGVFGPNGSGKTTIVSLLCSDHPQTYSLPIKLFGRSRLPEPGQVPLTLWDIQARIGHSGPEVHQHMPRSLTIRQVVENAWAPTFRTQAKLDETAREKVEAALAWFAAELDPSSSGSTSSSPSTAWTDEHMFGELSFSAQRVALFIRSMIKNPAIVVLDEAFSGMDDTVRDKCAQFLIRGTGETRGPIRGLGEDQALICIAHVKEEVPDCVREWICLPEANTGKPARFGRLDGPLRQDARRWNEIWG